MVKGTRYVKPGLFKGGLQRQPDERLIFKNKAARTNHGEPLERNVPCAINGGPTFTFVNLDAVPRRPAIYWYAMLKMPPEKHVQARPGVAVICQQGFVSVLGHAGLTPLHPWLFRYLTR